MRPRNAVRVVAMYLLDATYVSLIMCRDCWLKITHCACCGDSCSKVTLAFTSWSWTSHKCRVSWTRESSIVQVALRWLALCAPTAACADAPHHLPPTLPRPPSKRGMRAAPERAHTRAEGSRVQEVVGHTAHSVFRMGSKYIIGNLGDCFYSWFLDSICMFDNYHFHKIFQIFLCVIRRIAVEILIL